MCKRLISGRCRTYGIEQRNGDYRLRRAGIDAAFQLFILLRVAGKGMPLPMKWATRIRERIAATKTAHSPDVCELPERSGFDGNWYFK